MATHSSTLATSCKELTHWKRLWCWEGLGAGGEGDGRGGDGWMASPSLWMWTLNYKESWAPRIDAFELWYWRRLLRVTWTARRSNQSILKEISPGCSLEGMMLKLKLQYFGHLMQRVDSLEKTLMLGRIGGQEEKGTTEDKMAGWHHWLDGRGFGWTPGVDDGQGGLATPFMGSQRIRREWVTELNWTESIY